MNDNLSEVLFRIGQEHKENIRKDSRHYREVSIARKAAEMGFTEIEALYEDAFAIVPLKNPASGMKVRIDGRTFVNYAQFSSGVVVPQYVAKQVDALHKAYVAKDSMICNFAQRGGATAVLSASNVNQRERVLERIAEAHRFMESNQPFGNSGAVTAISGHGNIQVILLDCSCDCGRLDLQLAAE